MKNSVFSAKKTWRNFRRRGRYDALVRRVCYGAILLEAAVLLQRYGGGDFFALRTESESRQWQRPAEDASGNGAAEEIFGFRLRLRDGALEFYRQEEIESGLGNGTDKANSAEEGVNAAGGAAEVGSVNAAGGAAEGVNETGGAAEADSAAERNE